MEGTMGPDEFVNISLERWRWEQVLVGLDRYVSVLREANFPPKWNTQRNKLTVGES